MAILSFCGPSGVWWYGDIELGDEYYYMVDPAFNAIQNLKTNGLNRTIGVVLKNIEYIGFNEDFIIAVNKDSLNLKYWIIDKNRNLNVYEKTNKKQFGNEELIGPIDSLEFMNFKAKQEIEIKSKSYYRKKLNYE